MKSEKALLLNQFNCTDDHGMDEIKQHVASMESSLKTLNRQEEKYTAELDAALAQYAELQQQAADTDTIELDTTCHAIRSDKDRETAQRLQAAHGKKFDSGTLAQSRKDIAKILDESVEPVSIREKLQQSIQQDNKHRHMKGRSRDDDSL